MNPAPRTARDLPGHQQPHISCPCPRPLTIPPRKDDRRQRWGGDLDRYCYFYEKQLFSSPRQKTRKKRTKTAKNRHGEGDITVGSGYSTLTRWDPKANIACYEEALSLSNRRHKHVPVSLTCLPTTSYNMDSTSCTLWIASPNSFFFCLSPLLHHRERKPNDADDIFTAQYGVLEKAHPTGNAVHPCP